MAAMLVAFTACKKDEEEEKLTADFSVKVGYFGYIDENTYPRFLNQTADNLSVIVFDESNKAESYFWEWGDDESGYGVEIPESATYESARGFNTHRYSEPGIYTITLTVSNGEGKTDCKSKTVTIL